MMLSRGIRQLLFSAMLLAPIGSLHAQNGPPKFDPAKEPRRDYVQFEFAKDAEAIIRERLRMEQQLGPFKDLVRQILADPDKFGIDPEMFKDVKMDDEKLKTAVRNWAASDPALQKAVRDWVKRMPADKRPEVQKLQKELKEVLDQPPSKKTAELKTPIGPRPLEPREDPDAKAAEKLMIQAEQSKVGEWLKNSEAWKQAFRDLRSSLDQPDQSRWKTGDWPAKLGFTQGKALKLAEASMSRLRELPKPDLQRWQWSRSLPGMGKLPTPNLGTPELPSLGGAALPSLGTAATWLLLIAAFLLAVWQLRRWTRRRVAEDHRAQLGPWPVRPDAVSTRTELVQAFDYLALWSLGLEVRSWNHQAIVRGWCAKAPASAELARALASLYETARYTDGVDELPGEVRERARRLLLRLTEVL